jgi:hypothetical protein
MAALRVAIEMKFWAHNGKRIDVMMMMVVMALRA